MPEKSAAKPGARGWKCKAKIMILQFTATKEDQAARERFEKRLEMKCREERRQRKASFLQKGSGKSWHRSNRFSL